VNFEFDLYYSRHFPLRSIGRENQERLKNFTVAVAGIGGLGTVSSELLASIGVGRIKLIDYDIVEQSNLARQRLFSLKDIGLAKVDVAKEKLLERNPTVIVEPFAVSLDGLSVREFLHDVDLVIDGLDLFGSRRPLHAYCMQKKIPYIFAGSVADGANIMSFTFEKDKPCMYCVFGYIQDNENTSCEALGVHPSILTITASIQVAEALKILFNQKSNLVDEMMIIDLDELTFDKVKVNKNPNCEECLRIDQMEDKGRDGEVKKSDFELETGKIKITSLCGRDTFIIDPYQKETWDFDLVKSIINKKWKVEAKGESAISFTSGTIKMSLLNSGVMTIRGAELKENALSSYQKVLKFINTNLESVN
jgi:molybdopterin-synthase adenylyltransferase